MKMKVLFLLCAVLLTGIIGIALPVQALDYTAQEIATPITVVNVSFLNMRSGPGAQYSVITQLVGGSSLPVLGTDSTGTWTLVNTPVGAGWVYAQYTLPRGDFRFVPVLSAPPGSASVTVTTPLYIGMGTANYAAVTTAQVAPQTGVIMMPAPALAAPTLIVNTSYLNIRSGPGGYFTVAGVAVGGQTFTPLGITPDGEWFLIEGSFGRGWVDQDYVLFRGIIDNVPIIFAY